MSEVLEYNHVTGETLVREMTNDEIENLENQKSSFEETQADKLAKKAELLAKLGISEDDAKLLLS